MKLRKYWAVGGRAGAHPRSANVIRLSFVTELKLKHWDSVFTRQKCVTFRYSVPFSLEQVSCKFTTPRYYLTCLFQVFQMRVIEENKKKVVVSEVDLTTMLSNLPFIHVLHTARLLPNLREQLQKW